MKGNEKVSGNESQKTNTWTENDPKGDVTFQF